MGEKNRVVIYFCWAALFLWLGRKSAGWWDACWVATAKERK